MMQNRNYKRQTRQMPERTKQLISQKLKGRKKSPQHIERISTGMQNFWKTVKDSDESI
jgi:hypothetical protein